MRCPYCGGLNPDTTKYCVRCGRDVSVQQPVTQQRPLQPPAFPPEIPVNPRQVAQQRLSAVPGSTMMQPEQQRGSTIRVPPQGAHPSTASRRRTANEPPVDAFQPAEPAAPEAPAPFPPGTVAQLKMLEQGALAYTFVDDNESYGKKRAIRIVYPRCSSWQQVATLLKALREYDATKFDKIVIQGVHEQNITSYGFTNGQLVFDRNVRLGSQIQNRYQIETGNGFASDAVRIVLSE